MRVKNPKFANVKIIVEKGGKQEEGAVYYLILLNLYIYIYTNLRRRGAGDGVNAAYTRMVFFFFSKGLRRCYYFVTVLFWHSGQHR